MKLPATKLEKEKKKEADPSDADRLNKEVTNYRATVRCQLRDSKVSAPC
jgi:hypothetical protein